MNTTTAALNRRDLHCVRKQILMWFVALICGGGQIACKAAPLAVGDIVAVKQVAGTVHVIDPVSGAVTEVPVDSPTGLGGLSQAIVDSSGRIITATRNPGGVLRIDPDAEVTEVVADGPLLRSPSTVALENESTLLVGDTDSGLMRVDLATGEQNRINALRAIQDIEVGRDGTIYILDAGFFNSGGGNVRTLNPDTGQLTVLAEGGTLFNPGDMSLSPSGDLVVSNRRANSLSEIIQIDVDSGQQEVLLTFPSTGFIAHENNRHLVIGDFRRDQVIRADLVTGALETIADLGDPGSITGIAVYIPEPQAVGLAVVCTLLQLGTCRSSR